MSKTTISVDSVNKVVNMTVAGQMTMEDANLFLEDYKNKITPLDGEKYALVVDCTEMNILTQDMTDSLTGGMQLYKETGFYKVTYTIKGNAVLKMQLSRIAKNAGLTNYEVVDA